MPETALALYGSPVSNYFNVVRSALTEKRLPFEIVARAASRDEAFLAMNPMGKIPVLRIGNEHFSETVAILELLDDLYPEMPLRPTDPRFAARMRQAINIIQVYIEVPTRSLFPGVFIGGEQDAGARAKAAPILQRACGALARMLEPAPFLLGKDITQADLFAFFNFDIADRVTRYVYGESTMADIKWFAVWDARMRERLSICEALEDFRPAFQAYIVDKRAPYSDAREAEKRETAE